MSAQKQEDQDSSMTRLAPTTARPSKPYHFLHSYAFGYNPYATVHLRKPRLPPQRTDSTSQDRRSRINDIANSPFKRISRVEEMIHQQKQHLIPEDNEPDGVRHQLSLRPHFKVRTAKHPPKHTPSTAPIQEPRIIHYQNLSLECPLRAQSSLPCPVQDEKNSSGSNFQEIWKNRRKLNRKSPRKKIEASLLDMLNRISQEVPIQRYKSKAFDHSSKVTSFLPHS